MTLEASTKTIIFTFITVMACYSAEIRLIIEEAFYWSSLRPLILSPPQCKFTRTPGPPADFFYFFFFNSPTLIANEAQFALLAVQTSALGFFPRGRVAPAAGQRKITRG